MFFNFTFANEYLKLRIAHKLPVTYIAVTDFQLNRVRENMERSSVTEHRRNPLSRWTKLPPAHGNPARLGDLPHMGWDPVDEVSRFIHLVRYSEYELRRSSMATFLATPDERDAAAQMREDALRIVRRKIPNLTTAAHMLLCGVVEQNVAVAAAIQISCGSKRVEVEFEHLRKSKRMQGATTNHLVSFVARGRPPDLVAIGWPRPFKTWNELLNFAGGISGIVNEREFMMSANPPRAPTEDGVRQYLIAMRRNTHTGSVHVSEKVKIGMRHCVHVARANPAVRVNCYNTARLWGYPVGPPLFPFDGGHSRDMWARVVLFAEQVETEWNAHGLRPLLEDRVRNIYAATGTVHTCIYVHTGPEDTAGNSSLCVLM